MEGEISKKLTFNFLSLGTEIGLQLVLKGQNKIRESGIYFDEIGKIYESGMKTFSRFDKESELSLINANLGKKTSCSPWMKEVAQKSIEYYKQTDGVFDPRIIGELERAGYDGDFKKLEFATKKDQIINQENLKVNQNSLEDDLIIEDDGVIFKVRMDFSGIVKGFITDQVADYLKSVGINNYLVDSGGDIAAYGSDEDCENWNISVEGVSEEKVIIFLKNESIATSGISRRKWEIEGKRRHHIINPKDPNNFSFELKSVTVLYPTTEQSDVMAKVLFLMGSEAGKEYARAHGVKCIFLGYNGNAWVSSAMKENILR